MLVIRTGQGTKLSTVRRHEQRHSELNDGAISELNDGAIIIQVVKVAADHVQNRYWNMR